MAVIGIDLGTTNSAIAYLKDGKAEIIPNKEGHRTTPSVFNINPHGEIQIGRIAKNAYPGAPNETVLEVKRLMGSGEKIHVGNKEFSPEEISSFYLKYLKESAEIFLGEPVTEAIVTVPAYFSDNQRRATQIAGKIAGLNIERVINEPTAAAIAFGIENMDSDANILIFDLGGGTFDVSVVEMFGGIVQVKASTGDNHLGGMDFDECLVKWLQKQVLRTHQYDLLVDGTEVERQQRYARIKAEAENVKIALSTHQTTQFNLPFIAMKNGMPLSIKEEITRNEFNAEIQKLVQTTLKHVERALEEANLLEEAITEVILIGGSTRLPLVQELVERKFNKAVRKDINPDEAVALGAAIQGAIKSGEIAAADGLMVVDVCPYALGVDAVEYVGGQPIYDVFSEIIPANTPIPTSNTAGYRTVNDGQTAMVFNIYQGDGVNQYVQKELKISSEEIFIDGIPSAPAGEQSVQVTFSYDINGMLDVSLQVMSTGKIKKATVQADQAFLMDIAKSQKKINENWRVSELYAEVKTVITRAERILPDLDNTNAVQVKQLLTALKSALAANNELATYQYSEQLTDVLISLV